LRVRNLWMEIGCRTYLTWLLVRAGRLEEAFVEAEGAVQGAEGQGPSLCTALGMRAHVQLTAGQPERALASVKAALDHLATSGVDEWEILVRLVHAESLMATGSAELARAAISAAHDRLLHLVEKLPPELHRSCLERIPEHARTMALARE